MPDSVCRAYGVQRLKFGREYLIPKPFDPRVLMWEARRWPRPQCEPASPRNPWIWMNIGRSWSDGWGRPRSIPHHDPQSAANPKHVVFPEGENEKILRACHALVEEKIAVPILLGDAAKDSAQGTRTGREPAGYANRRSVKLRPSRSSTFRNYSAFASAAGVTLRASEKANRAIVMSSDR